MPKNCVAESVSQVDPAVEVGKSPGLFDIGPKASGHGFNGNGMATPVSALEIAG